MAKRKHLLNQSCAWIREHWNATNLDVPDSLLAQWIYNPEEDADPNGFHLAVFTFGYLQRDLIDRNVPAGVSQSVSTAELLRLFDVWQLKLAMAEVTRRTHLAIKPVPLFAFPPGETIEACERTAAAPARDGAAQ